MGLDMYLTAKKYLWSHNSNGPVKQEPTALTKDLQDLGITHEIKQIEVEGAYWRKAWVIHNWFVINVQDGDDECDNYSVSRGQLAELKEVCQQVLLVPALASDLLPKESFSFGGNLYNEHYFWVLKETVKQLDRCLLFPKEWDFEYRASW